VEGLLFPHPPIRACLPPRGLLLPAEASSQATDFRPGPGAKDAAHEAPEAGKQGSKDRGDGSCRSIAEGSGGGSGGSDGERGSERRGGRDGQSWWGAKVQVTSDGSVPQAKLTVPVNPPVGVSVITVEPEDPVWMVSDDGFALSV